MVRASEHSQVWVVSHGSRLISALESHSGCNSIQLDKTLGQTEVVDQGVLNRPAWHRSAYNKCLALNYVDPQQTI